MKDDICANVNILKINNKTKNILTIKCVTEIDANLLEQKITNNYRGHIKVNKVDIKKIVQIVTF